MDKGRDEFQRESWKGKMIHISVQYINLKRGKKRLKLQIKNV